MWLFPEESVPWNVRLIQKVWGLVAKIEPIAPGCARTKMRVRRMRTFVIATIPMTLHVVIVAVAISVIEAIVVSLLMLALRRRSRIVTSYDLLLKSNRGCIPNAFWSSGMVILLQVIGSHISISQDYIVLMSVRVIIAMNMSITSMPLSEINGTTSISTEARFCWCRSGTLLSEVLKMLAVALVSDSLLQLAICLNRSR